MLRLDKYLCDMNIGSRSQVKKYIGQGLVTVNGAAAKHPETKIDEQKDAVAFKGQIVAYQKYVYYMLDKPSGVVSATEDRQWKTAASLLKDTGYPDLFPVGRLDKDTEGLLLMTNDGQLAHNLLSPKKHVPKIYLVRLEKEITKEAVKQLEAGVDIGESRPTLPAKVQMIDPKSLLLTITEGKYHQVKRMLQAVDNKVLYLKRIAMGSLYLDEALPPGSYRALTQEELRLLQ